jgi:hypothetical protein
MMEAISPYGLPPGYPRWYRRSRAWLTKACAWLSNALIWRPAMLSTTANPTDGLRFDGDAMASPQVLFIH